MAGICYSSSHRRCGRHATRCRQTASWNHHVRERRTQFGRQLQIQVSYKLQHSIELLIGFEFNPLPDGIEKLNQMNYYYETGSKRPMAWNAKRKEHKNKSAKNRERRQEVRGLTQLRKVTKLNWPSWPMKTGSNRRVLTFPLLPNRHRPSNEPWPLLHEPTQLTRPAPPVWAPNRNFKCSVYSTRDLASIANKKKNIQNQIPWGVLWKRRTLKKKINEMKEWDTYQKI